MSIPSQDTYLNLTTPLSVVGGGGAAPSNPNPSFSTVTTPGLVGISSINGSAYIPGALPVNPQFSTVSVPGLLNVSSINGAAYNAGGVPANLVVSSISTLALDNVSSINGVAYTGSAVPSDLVVSSVTAQTGSVSTLTVSSINGSINLDDIPYLFLQQSGLKDSVISSLNAAAGGNTALVMSSCAARLTGNFSTVRGHQYIASGFARIIPVAGAGSWPAGSPNAYLGLYGGGGAVPGFINGQIWTYPQLSTLAGLTPGGASVDLQWTAPGAHSYFNPDTGAQPSTNTINYKLYCSPDWPVAITVQVSTVIGQLAALGREDTANVSFVDLGNFNDAPPV